MDLCCQCTQANDLLKILKSKKLDEVRRTQLNITLNFNMQLMLFDGKFPVEDPNVHRQCVEYADVESFPISGSEYENDDEGEEEEEEEKSGPSEVE